MSGDRRNNPRIRTTRSSDAMEGRRVPKAKSNWKPHLRRNKDGNFLINFNVNMKFMLALSMAGFFISIALIYHLINAPEELVEHRAVTPFPAKKITDLPQFQGEHRESLYWGTYRSHLYFGIRARRPKSLLAGLMWIGIKNGRYFLRHVCQDSDELTTYGWRKHNGRDYGYQVLVDHGMTLSTSFLKSKVEGSGYGGDWAVRIELQSNGTKDVESGHLFFYVADEGGSVLNLGSDHINIPRSSLLASGLLEEVGNWQLHLYSEDDINIHYSGFNTRHFHNLSGLVEDNLEIQARTFGRLHLSDTLDELSNILAFQVSARIPFAVDIAFLSGRSRSEMRFGNLSGTSLSNHLSKKDKQFDDKFEDVFNLNDQISSENSMVGKAAIGNMLGGIGYFYGQSKISFPVMSNRNKGGDFLLYWLAELYTSVPSRSFFPRGFLWDEGFHQLLICRWDLKICLDIIGHWLDLMNVDGWIPREQILGAEALSKVPEEFVLQHPSNGNPPTLFLALQELIYDLKSNKFTTMERSDITTFLDRAFVRLEAWFQWFNITQAGLNTGTYYWHGRDNTTARELNPKTLSSGLDDYPRASHPSDEERHLDLRCWMLLAADCLHSISEHLGRKHGSPDYFATAKLLSNFHFLNQVHFDQNFGAYFDFGNHTEKVRMIWRMVEHDDDRMNRELLRETLAIPELKFVPHVGYVSLFPFIAKIIPADSWILGRQLDIISNQSILWSDYGIRSLAKTSSLYMKRNTEHDAPYWRGQIWMNMNYLILSSLHHYSNVDGPYRELSRSIYHELRRNLIRNVVDNYNETGYLWEQYDQKKGNGKGARVFTGWTALVLLVMSETYNGQWNAASL